MKRINNFVDSVYTHNNGSKKEINELKEEMKSHLIESVHELQKEGKTEDEAITMAIKRFGEKTELQAKKYNCKLNRFYQNLIT